MELTVVSIGTLSKNPFWDEKAPVRTSHATTTLLRSGQAVVLVDPSLPAQALQPRLFERTGLQPDAITHVFLTSFRPVHRRGLRLFEKAQWLLAEREMEFAEEQLRTAEHRAAEGEHADRELQAMVADELALLKKCRPAPDSLAEGIDLFPLPGYTPGQAGLLVGGTTITAMVAGDAVPTAAHFLAGRIFEDCYDIEKAKDSMAEMYEIADLIVPGHDNLFLNPRTAGF